MEDDNIIEETIEFDEDLYQKNINENSLDIEYEGGNINANNEC